MRETRTYIHLLNTYLSYGNSFGRVAFVVVVVIECSIHTFGRFISQFLLNILCNIFVRMFYDAAAR